MLNKKQSVKAMCLCAICIALCVVLPMVFHGVGLGPIFLPMHIPVLLCGLICGWFYGALCGILGPILSSLLTGMPPAPVLMSMVPELCLYGLVGGLLVRTVQFKSVYANLYTALVGAMLAGRIVGGIAKALVLFSGGKPIVFSALVSGYFVTSWPGILIQLALIPSLVFMLMKARLIPEQFEGAAR